MGIRVQSIIIGIIGVGLSLAGLYLLLYDSTYLTGSCIIYNTTGKEVCVPNGLNYPILAAGLTLFILGNVIMVVYAIKRKPVSSEMEKSRISLEDETEQKEQAVKEKLEDFA